MEKGLAIGASWLGVVVSYVGTFTEIWFLSIFGFVVALIGTFFWAVSKKRHWAFGFWGILAPIGFLGVALLKDRNSEKTKDAPIV